MMLGIIIKHKDTENVLLNEVTNTLPEEYLHYKKIVEADGFEELIVPIGRYIVKIYKRFFPSYEKEGYIDSDDDYLELGCNH